MKRTVTEIFIEVEETATVRLLKAKPETAEKDAAEQTSTACPLCGQTIPKMIENSGEK